MNVPVPDLKGTPFDDVKFHFCNVTPELAAEWLKRNTSNRRLREGVMEKYVMDMANGAWMTTHEGIAFDADGKLTDGQHRLEAVVRAKKPMLILVSTGWPLLQGKRSTMDAVNMGANRSIADQIHLRHGFPRGEATKIVMLCNSIAAAAFNIGKVPAATTDSILGVLALYQAEIKWWIENPIRDYGLGQVTVAMALVMGRAVWADKMEDARNRLRTGVNLGQQNPLLHLRNWLMTTDDEKTIVRQATFHHLAAFVDGKSLPQIVINSHTAYMRVLKLHKVRVEKICALYGRPLPEFIGQAPAPTEDVGKGGPFSPEAIKVGESLPAVFSSTDLLARTDVNVGHWLIGWRNAGWIESAGVKDFRKTEKFGKTTK